MWSRWRFLSGPEAFRWRMKKGPCGPFFVSMTEALVALAAKDAQQGQQALEHIEQAQVQAECG